MFVFEKARITGSNRYPLFRSNHVFLVGSVNAPVSDTGGWEREMNGEEGDVERNKTDIYPLVSGYFALS